MSPPPLAAPPRGRRSQTHVPPQSLHLEAEALDLVEVGRRLVGGHVVHRVAGDGLVAVWGGGRVVVVVVIAGQKIRGPKRRLVMALVCG